jgi:hypothetical protein
MFLVSLLLLLSFGALIKVNIASAAVTTKTVDIDLRIYSSGSLGYLITNCDDLLTTSTSFSTDNDFEIQVYNPNGSGGWFTYTGDSYNTDDPITCKLGDDSNDYKQLGYNSFTCSNTSCEDTYEGLRYDSDMSSKYAFRLHSDEYSINLGLPDLNSISSGSYVSTGLVLNPSSAKVAGSVKMLNLQKSGSNIIGTFQATISNWTAFSDSDYITVMNGATQVAQIPLHQQSSSTNFSVPYSTSNITLTATNTTYGYSKTFTITPHSYIPTIAEFELGKTYTDVTVQGYSGAKQLTIKNTFGVVVVKKSTYGSRVNYSALKNGKYTATIVAGTAKKTISKTFTATQKKAVSFKDMKGQSSETKVAAKWLSKVGVTTGIGNSKYAPKNPVTRAQMAMFLYRMAGSPKFNPTKQSFKDVKKAAGEYAAIEWLKSTKITTGVSKTKFNPKGTVTRAQMAMFLYRYVSSPSISSKTPFKDAKGTELKKATNFLNSKGVAKGFSKTKFSPSSYCTRAQMALFLYRLADKINLR